MFGKKKKDEKKSKLDKLIMGAIVGGAIGSVVGMSIAPKKGKETREMISQKGKEALEKGKELTQKVRPGLKNENIQDGTSESHKKGFLMKLKEKLLSKKRQKELNSADHLRKIPREE